MAIKEVEAIEVSCAWGAGWMVRPGIPVHFCPDCAVNQRPQTAEIAVEGFQARVDRALDAAREILMKGRVTDGCT